MATTVVSGMSALRRPCLTSTLRYGTPFARPKRMYSELITSSIEARWKRLHAAKLSAASAIVGRTRWESRSQKISDVVPYCEMPGDSSLAV